MVTVDTKIMDVVVFLDQARIIRQGYVQLEDPGIRLFEVTELPLLIVPDSVRVRARGTARTRIMGVDVKKTFFKEIPQGKARELSDKIQSFKDQEKEVVDQSEAFIAQIKHLDSLADAGRVYALSLAKGESTLERHSSLLDFVLQRRVDIQYRLRLNHIQLRNLENERKQLENQLNLVQGAKPKERYSAVVEIEILEKGSLEIELIYMQRGAYWQPLYDIRWQGGKLEVTYLAQVGQSSGEDWESVSLTLSTARPAATGVLPQLEPWYIAPLAPVGKGMAMRGMPAAAPVFAKMRMAADEAMPVPAPAAMVPEAEPEILEAEVAAAEVSGSDTFVTYKLSQKVDIPGNNTPRKNTVAIFSLEPKFEYIVVPRLQELAFRRINTENNSSYILLPGNVQLFVEDDYLGSSELK